MPDIVPVASETAARAAFTAASGAITPAAAEAFKAQAKAAGLSDEQVTATLARFGIGDAAPQTTPQPNPATAPDTLNPVTKAGGYTAEQAQTAYDNWVRLGLPEEQIRAALEADGFAEVDDGRSEAETAFDNSALGAATDASAYQLNYTGRPQVDVAQLQALDSEFRTAFAAASVPAQMGQGLVDAMLDTGTQFSALPSDAARGLYKAEQKAMLGRLGDVDTLITLASVPLGRMGKDFVEMMHESGALESAVTIRRLAQIGELILHREGLAKAQR